jgi:hypothetical protein
MKRKYFVVFTVLLILGTLLVPNASFADSISSTNNSVTIAEAEKAALNQIEITSQRIAEWIGATVGKPVIYYAPDNTQSAYEFTVVNGEKEVGFILVSARKDWMPVLEYSPDPAPSKLLPEIVKFAVDNGYADQRETVVPMLIYWGALSYSVQLGEKMKEEGIVIHLPTAQIMPMPEMSEPRMDKEQANIEWAKQVDGRYQTRSVEWVEIAGVPIWYQHNSACGGCCDAYSIYAEDYPDCAGTDPDPWAYWDGCSPIAGAMIVGYWLGELDDDEAFIDDCHYYMETSNNGTTYPLNIDNGLEDVLNTLYGQSVDAINDLYVSWNDVTGEINAERPFVLCDDDHSYTCVGYEYDTGNPNYKKVWVHTGWAEPKTAVLDFSYWNGRMMVKVIP